MKLSQLRRILVSASVSQLEGDDPEVKIQHGEHTFDIKAITYETDNPDGDDPVVIEVERYYGGRWESDMVNTRPGGTV